MPNVIRIANTLHLVAHETFPASHPLRTAASIRVGVDVGAIDADRAEVLRVGLLDAARDLAAKAHAMLGVDRPTAESFAVRQFLRALSGEAVSAPAVAVVSRALDALAVPHTLHSAAVDA